MDAAVTLHISPRPSDLDALASVLRGRVVRRRDADFAVERGVWNTAFQAEPVAIVRVADAGDVATTIGFARHNDLEIAVRSGGHSVAGHSTGDGVLTIDLRDLRGLHVDLGAGIAWAGAGLTAGDVTAALSPYGMAVPFGDTASVGLGGITLGGGIGYLVRKHGLTIDSLVAAEVVTADGEVRTASATEHADLFWAIRGGGGNFGVATRFCYRLSPVGEVLGGAIVLPATRDVLRSLVPIAASAPDELTVIAQVMEAPTAPFVDDEHVGKLSLFLLFVYAGDPDAGRAAIAPFRAVAAPYGELVTPMPYSGIYEFSRGAEVPGPSTVRSIFTHGLEDAAVDAILAAMADAPPASMVQLRVFGGAMGRVAGDATAFAHRGATAMIVIINPIVDASVAEETHAWNRALYSALRPAAAGVYVNFLEDEGDERIGEAYPVRTYERLAAIKRRYDPHNVFRRNQNVRPARVRSEPMERETGVEPAASTLGRSRSAN